MSATVLVVDDEKNIRRALRMVLEGAGLRVLDAPDAESGLELLFAGGIDLVILDVKLPKMNGIEALERIRQRPETRGLPVLMISGHASVADAVHAVQRGATDFFEKPVDRELMMSRVRNALRTFQLEREVDALRASVERRYEMIGEADHARALRAARENRSDARARPRHR